MDWTKPRAYIINMDCRQTSDLLAYAKAKAWADYHAYVASLAAKEIKG